MAGVFSTGERVKKLLFASVMSLAMVVGAGAADLMPAPAPVPVYTKAPPPAWSWTGFYLGLQGGAGWGTSQDSTTATQLAGGPVVPNTVPGLFQSSYGLNGFHGGGTAGFNWQTGPIVWGVEGDISAADINGSGDCTSLWNTPLGFQPTGCQTKMTAFGTLTGRLGVTVDHALVYVKAGGAWAHFNHNSVAIPDFPVIPVTASISDNRSGYTVGTGIEYKFWHGWSAKVEYNYMDFGTRNLTFAYFLTTTGALFATGFADDKERVHVVKAGLNYRFNWWGSNY
jgi:outer membrane immunogenic protein